MASTSEAMLMGRIAVNQWLLVVEHWVNEDPIIRQADVEVWDEERGIEVDKLDLMTAELFDATGVAVLLAVTDKG